MNVLILPRGFRPATEAGSQREGAVHPNKVGILHSTEALDRFMGVGSKKCSKGISERSAVFQIIYWKMLVAETAAKIAFHFIASKKAVVLTLGV